MTIIRILFPILFIIFFGIALTGKTGGVKVMTKAIGVALAVVILLLVVLFVARSCSGDKKPPENNTNTAAISRTSSTSSNTTEKLELVQECITPCEVFINFPAKIRRNGVPVRIFFPGGDSVDFNGGVNAKTPNGVTSGTRRIVSLDPEQQHVPIKIFKLTIE